MKEEKLEEIKNTNDFRGKRSRSSAYPNFNIERCIEFAERIFNKGARHVLLDVAAKEMGYNNKRVGPFLALRAAAKYFGLVEYEGDYISITEDYINVLVEKSEGKKKKFISQAVTHPTLYAKLFDAFGGKQLPSEQDLAVRLHIDRKYGISKEASSDAAKVFIESVRYANMLDGNNYLIPPGQELSVEQNTEEKEEISGEKVLKGKQSPSLLDRYEFTLETGEKIVLMLPPRLSQKDKNRLKTIIDFIPDMSNDNNLSPKSDGSFSQI